MLLAILLAGAVHLPVAAGPLKIIEDDYPKALALAKKQHKPLFVDFGASWCHTCLSMQRTVMRDPGLKPVASAVVWLGIDTEIEGNKALVEKFPLDVWPTFLILNPDDETVIARWLGAASVPDFRGFVQQGAEAYRARQKPQSPAAAEQRKGDEARLQNDLPASADAYARALAQSPADDPQRPERLSLYANALRKLHTAEASRTCVKLALDEMDQTGESAIVTDFIGFAGACASALPKDDPDVVRLRVRSIQRLSVLLARSDAPLSADDRSDGYAALIELLDAAGRHGDAETFARKRAAVLEAAAARASDATQAAIYDPHRTETYLYLQQPEKAEKLLAAREKEMPDDYNPPARLARVLLEEHKLPEAEAAVDRALSKMTRGNRRVGILGLKARILAARNEPVQAVLKEQLEVMRGLPRFQRDPEAEQKLEQQLASSK